MGVRLSYDGCPNSCIDGYYIDPYSHRRKECLYCKQKRIEASRNGIVTEDVDGNTIKVDSGLERLNIPKSYYGVSFEPEAILPQFARKDMKAETIQPVLDVMYDLFCKISVGDNPDRSYLFNLGKKSFEQGYISAIMRKAHENGKVVAPFVTDIDVFKARNGDKGLIEDLTLDELISADLCVVMILAGANKVSILGVKGLMEYRALRGRGTIIFTKAWDRFVQDLCNDPSSTEMNLASLYSVEYDDKYVAQEAKREKLMQEAKPVRSGDLLSLD